ncbi:MAG TPA: ROK family protein, partial [Anaerolineae bacterium]|nr:ROK family protein [Anaerolineae bacterium]
MLPGIQSRRGALGVDLGGSSAKIGLVADTGELLAAAQVSLTAPQQTQIVLDSLRRSLDQLCDQASAQRIELAAVGCGVSGNLDPAG